MSLIPWQLALLACLWTGKQALLWWFLLYISLFICVSCYRQALFGDHVKKPQSLEDTDLSRLYTATSLMQIDDNVMRWVPKARPEVLVSSAQHHCLAPLALVASFHFSKSLVFRIRDHRKMLISWKWVKTMTSPPMWHRQLKLGGEVCSPGTLVHLVCPPLYTVCPASTQVKISAPPDLPLQWG